MQIQLQDSFCSFLILVLSFSMLYMCSNVGVTKESLKSVDRVGKKKIIVSTCSLVLYESDIYPTPVSTVIGKNTSVFK